MAAVRLFVGGLAFTTSTDGLRAAFARFGPVQSAAVMTDRETGRSRGFGFVEMASEEEAEKAISGLNGSSLDGRMIRVDRATPRGAGGPRPAGAGGPRSDRPGGGGYAPRPAGAGYGQRPGGGGGGFAPRPGGGGPPRSGGGWTPPMPEGRPGGSRRGSGGGGNRRPGEPSGGEQRRPGNKKPGGKPTAPGEEKRGGRGRLGSDGDYRWGR
ncbi:MAG: RNA-binding protein [Candidatus Rokuibacteriota bacterium]|jgi:RNA recognition motif-containing protein|nr:RNA-binding protein [Patescibacteria group bacterium]